METLCVRVSAVSVILSILLSQCVETAETLTRNLNRDANLWHVNTGRRRHTHFRCILVLICSDLQFFVFMFILVSTS